MDEKSWRYTQNRYKYWAETEVGPKYRTIPSQKTSSLDAQKNMTQVAKLLVIPAETEYPVIVDTDGQMTIEPYRRECGQTGYYLHVKYPKVEKIYNILYCQPISQEGL